MDGGGAWVARTRASGTSQRRRPPIPRSAAGSDQIFFLAGSQSSLQPQLVTPRMEVCFASVGFGRVERVKIEGSQLTRCTHATGPFALVLRRRRVADGIGEARAEPFLDERAFGAQPIGFQLGNRAADSADLFVDRPAEEAQTHCRHCVLPANCWKEFGNARRRGE